MLNLVKTARKQNLRGYIWQLSNAGYHYEVEVVNQDGDIRYNKQHRISFEDADKILDDQLTVIAAEDTQSMFAELG